MPKIKRNYIITTLLLFVSFKVFANTDELDLKELQSLFYQIIALFGLALAAYLYINLRNNKKSKRQLPQRLETNNQGKDIVGNMRQVVNLIPYAACISNENQKVVISNLAYDNYIKANGSSLEHCWDRQLNIDYKSLTFNTNDEALAVNRDGNTFKLTIKPFEIAETEIKLYSLVIEEVSDPSLVDDITKRTGYIKNTINNANFPIIIINNELKIVDFNDKGIGLIGRPSNDLLNKSIGHFFPDDEVEPLRSFLKGKSNGNEGINSFHIINKSNNLIPVEIDHIPYDFFGTNSNICIIKDISERIHLEQEILKAKERAEESDRLKSSFLANMSHEVRTPLNSIMGFTELMSDELINHKERKEFHNIVKNSSNELLSLLNDIMEFSKIESGLIKIDIADVCPHEIVNELAENLKPQFTNNSNIDFRIKEPVGVENHGKLQSDKHRIIQVLKHLLDNAIKFTYSGTITLSHQYRPDNSIEFIVSDTGIGIPQSKIPNIFHKFRQANDNNSRDFGGAGLGLSICKHLANVLGGFLWVSSVENHGSDFHFILPEKYNSNTDFRYNNTLVYYSKDPKPIPIEIADTKSLSVYVFAALLNIPLAHNVSAILIDAAMENDELALLLALPQIKSATVIQYNKKESEVIYSPMPNDINLKLKGKNELDRYLSKFFERKHSY